MSYKVSKDYPRLKQLLDEGRKIVCWVTWDWTLGENDMVTDIAEAKRSGEGECLKYMIYVRGNCFFEAHPNWKGFNQNDEWMYKQWKKDNLQFIDLDPERNTLTLERAKP